ncbi:hypothetical protein B0H11DRAFT_1922041 [Mycena galericulata]|nr:hypothetical protein B0H11DRAFT_1922041 [Mycena galericulata]
MLTDPQSNSSGSKPTDATTAKNTLEYFLLLSVRRSVKCGHIMRPYNALLLFYLGTLARWRGNVAWKKMHLQRQVPEQNLEKKKREEKEETEHLCTLVPSLKAEDFARYGSLTDFYWWFKELQARQRYHHDVAAYYFMDQMQWRRICKDPRVWASQAWKDSDYSVSEEDEDIRHGDRGEWKIVRENYRILWDWKRIEHEEKRTQFEKERIRLEEERERQEWYSIDTADLYVGAGGWDAIWEGSLRAVWIEIEAWDVGKRWASCGIGDSEHTSMLEIRMNGGPYVGQFGKIGCDYSLKTEFFMTLVARVFPPAGFRWIVLIGAMTAYFSSATEETCESRLFWGNRRSVERLRPSAYFGRMRGMNERREQLRLCWRGVVHRVAVATMGDTRQAGRGHDAPVVEWRMSCRQGSARSGNIFARGNLFRMVFWVRMGEESFAAASTVSCIRPFSWNVTGVVETIPEIYYSRRVVHVHERRRARCLGAVRSWTNAVRPFQELRWGSYMRSDHRTPRMTSITARGEICESTSEAGTSSPWAASRTDGHPPEKNRTLDYGSLETCAGAETGPTVTHNGESRNPDNDVDPRRIDEA